MFKKKAPKLPTEHEIVEAKVDAMMAVERSPARPAAAEQSTTASPPPLDIFADPKTAPEVPKDLLKHLGAASSAGTAEEAAPAPVVLDDPVSDAAVDAIEAEEDATDEVTSTPPSSPAPTPEQPKPVHHHPVFWTFIFLVAIAAVAVAYLLATGGNASLPAGGVLHNLSDKLQH